MTALDKIIAWAARNERRLGAILFAFGFLTDFLTFGLLPVGIVTIIFSGYLLLAAISIFGAHATAIWHEVETRWKKGLAVLFPLAAQYAFGGLFSGFVVFYAKNSVIGVSWPFIVILVLLYAGNEYFRMYKQFLVYQTTLFFFALYAYAVFALPLVTGTLGPWTFGGSTLITVAAFALFLLLLRVLNRARFAESGRKVMLASAAVLVILNVSYFAGLIPPIPLALKDAGMYHSLVREGGGYRVSAEDPAPWWHFGRETITQAPGETIYAYSAVAAPGNLSGTVVHRWEYFAGGRWVTENKLSFPIVGGRAGGYRGYSFKGNLTEGAWRVSVETQSGQTIGRIRFDVQAGTPALHEETL